jgi:hypothetical protein
MVLSKGGGVDGDEAASGAEAEEVTPSPPINLAIGRKPAILLTADEGESQKGLSQRCRTPCLRAAGGGPAS